MDRITLEDLRGVVEWEGGLGEALEHIDLDEVPVVLESLWRDLSYAYKDVHHIEDKIYEVLYPDD